MLVALLVALLVAATACVTLRTRAYAPAPSDPRLTIGQIQSRTEAIIALECARLLERRRGLSGEADFTLTLRPDGGVATARLDHGAGDRRLDDIFGALAADLTVGSGPARARPPRLVVAFSCTPTAAVTAATLRPA